MDGNAFDRLARLAGSPAGRRATLQALLGVVAFGVAGDDGHADRRTRPATDLHAERKRRKRKKKRCTPQCVGRVCGSDSCGGSCGICAGPTGCDAEGRCVGCATASECPVLPCQVATCVDAVCAYTAATDGSACGENGRLCCSGSCANTRTDEEHCGACGNACGTGDACLGGVCTPVCDVCTSGCLFTTVQEAIDAAAAGATITICPGTYADRPFITKNLTLVGLGTDPAETVISFEFGPVVIVNPDASVIIRNLSITGSRSGTNGGVQNNGTLRLERVNVHGNTAENGGGGIANNGAKTLTLVDSAVRNNTAPSGGGIQSADGSVILIRSRVEANEAVQGGGMMIVRGAAVVSENSQVTGNTATGASGIFGGGVLNQSGTITVESGGSISGNDPDQCVNVDGSSCV